MNTTKKTAALLLGGLLAASAWAQDTSTMGASRSSYYPHASGAATSNVPTGAGEASTMTNGVPNMSTYNPDPDQGRLAMAQPQEVQRVPSRAGEASTMVGGRPNANPDNPALRR